MATKAKRFYVTPDGSKFPLFEAPYSYSITVYKSDCRKAVIGDPASCLIALGAKRDPMIESAHIGSGKDAYIVFKGTKERKAHALHFTIATQAAAVRDHFEVNKKAATQVVKLNAPTAGRTLAYREKLNRDRLARIKAGTHTPKKRDKKNQTRILRLGVAHRPRALVKNNVVTLVPRDSAAA